MSAGGRGQLLMPWPNRIRDGHYSFDGRELQLGLTDPGRGNASHGLARWAAWTLEEHTGTSVSLVYRLMAQTGYPWTLDLHVLYDLSADGLVVTQTATNLSPSPRRTPAARTPTCASGTRSRTSSSRCPPARGSWSTTGSSRPAPSRSRGVRLHVAAADRRRGPRRRLRRPGPRGRAGHRDAARALERPRGRLVGGRAAPLAAGLHAAPSEGSAPGAGRGADDGPGRRVQLRHRPRHPRPRRRRPGDELSASWGIHAPVTREPGSPPGSSRRSTRRGRGG